MSQYTVIIVGLSGVGKTTFIQELKEFLTFQHLSAGSIIKNEKERLAQDIQRDKLRFQDIADNQKLLVDGFHNEKDKDTPLIILDGHTVIDTPQGLEPIPANVFKLLEIDMFVFLGAKPEVIKRQRENDDSRNRPKIDIEAIDQQQQIAIKLTRKISQENSVQCEIVQSNDKEQLLKCIETAMSSQ